MLNDEYPSMLNSEYQMTLERLKFNHQVRIPRALLHGQVSAERSQLFPNELDFLTLELSAAIYGERLERQTVQAHKSVTFTQPATWWQHWKQDHAGKWYGRWIVQRWPVQVEETTQWLEVEIDVERFRTYPDANIAFNPTLGRPVIHMRRGDARWRETDSGEPPEEQG